MATSSDDLFCLTNCVKVKGEKKQLIHVFEKAERANSLVLLKNMTEWLFDYQNSI